MPDPTLTQIDDRELENMSVDAANFPYIKQRGNLYWTGSAWAKWEGTVTAGAGSSTAINDGTTTTDKAKVADGRSSYGKGLYTLPGNYFASRTALTDGQQDFLKLDSAGDLQVDVNNTVTVQATNLDIRDLTSASDSVSVLQATHDNLNLNANVQQGNADVSSTNELYVRGSGTAGTADAAVLTVQGIASMTPVQVSQATASNLNATVVQGTATNLKAEVVGTGTFAVQNNSTGKTLLSAGGSAASSGNNTLVAAGTNKLKVYAFTLSTTSTTAVTCIFQSGAGGTELWRVVLQAPSSVSTGANLTVTPPAWLFATASATLLNLNLSSAQTVHWSVSYFDEA